MRDGALSAESDHLLNEGMSNIFGTLLYYVIVIMRILVFLFWSW